jgi:hypothetical protein
MGNIEGIGPILWPLANKARKAHTDPHKSFAPINLDGLHERLSEHGDLLAFGKTEDLEKTVSRIPAFI